MDVDGAAETSSLKCPDKNPDIVITAPPAIPLVIIQPLPELLPEAPLPEDRGTKKKVPQKRSRPRKPKHPLYLQPHPAAPAGELEISNVVLMGKCIILYTLPKHSCYACISFFRTHSELILQFQLWKLHHLQQVT